MRFADALEARDLAQAVDMARHQMAAQPVVRAQRLFEIHLARRLGPPSCSGFRADTSTANECADFSITVMHAP